MTNELTCLRLAHNQADSSASLDDAGFRLGLDVISRVGDEPRRSNGPQRDRIGQHVRDVLPPRGRLIERRRDEGNRSNGPQHDRIGQQVRDVLPPRGRLIERARDEGNQWRLKADGRVYKGDGDILFWLSLSIKKDRDERSGKTAAPNISELSVTSGTY